LFDEKTGDHYYIKTASSDEITYVGEAERQALELAMLKQKI
jgi:hypothetical protein